mmetsp:Transcript_106378/g.282084  ORF Transcript_106378/g.282084 Transcript_106378/m.282084 type:complete len:447 (+) Transcript_106378:432-1772(+)
MSHHGLLGQAQVSAQSPHLVLEQQPQRLDELHLHPRWQTANVVVCLDDGGRATIGGGLNHVRVQRALQQEALLGLQSHLVDGLLEAIDEEPADDFSLLLGIRHASKSSVELLLGIDDHQFHAGDVLLEPLRDEDSLILAEQPGVHHEGPEFVFAGLEHQRGSHAGVDPAADSADDVLPRPELAQDRVDLHLREVVHVPVAVAAAEVHHEVADELATAWRVRDLRVELHAPHLPLLVLYRRVFTAARVRDGMEALGQLSDLVAVAHPYLNRLVNVLKQRAAAASLLRRRGARRRGVPVDYQRRIAELTLLAELHLAAERVAHLLKAVADAEDGNAFALEVLPYLLLEVRPIGVVHGVWAATQNDADRREVLDLLRRHQARPELTIHAGLADPSANEVADLRAEVDHQDASFLQLVKLSHVLCSVVGHCRSAARKRFAWTTGAKEGVH